MTTAATLSKPRYDPYSAVTIADPYPIYERLRESHPLYHNEQLGFYALSRYADIVEYGRDWQTFSYAHGADIDDTGDAFGPGNFLELDPPAHTTLRNIVRKAFSPKALTAWLEEIVEHEANELLGALIARGEGDFGTQVAWALPMRVASKLIGFPREDLSMLEALEQDFAHRKLGERTVPPAAAAASNQLRSYFADLIAATKARRSSDGLIAMIADAEIGIEKGASMAFLLWAASVETTACMLTNGAVLLDLHPDQRELLSRDSMAIPAAVEEILRFEAPLQVMRRTTTRPVEIYDCAIPTGSSIFTVYGAANRDKRKFPDADRFDVTREPQRHLAFGDGIHHCLGAPLARLEGRIVFRTLIEQSPRYAVRHDGLRRLEHYIVRGYTHVPMSFGR